MTTIDGAAFSNKVRRMLGLSLESWNTVMVAALALAAIAAAIVGVATYIVIRLQTAEDVATKREFEQYRIDAGRQIAETNAAAAEANARAAALEKETVELKLALDNARAETLRLSNGVARHITDAERLSFKTFLKDTQFRIIMISETTPEAKTYRNELADALHNAGAAIVEYRENTAGGTIGVQVYGNDDDAAGKRLAQILVNAGLLGVSFHPRVGEVLAIAVRANPNVP
jgi:hypothetical protein